MHPSEKLLIPRGKRDSSGCLWIQLYTHTHTHTLSQSCAVASRRARLLLRIPMGRHPHRSPSGGPWHRPTTEPLRPPPEHHRHGPRRAAAARPPPRAAAAQHPAALHRPAVRGPGAAGGGAAGRRRAGPGATVPAAAAGPAAARGWGGRPGGRWGGGVTGGHLSVELPPGDQVMGHEATLVGSHPVQPHPRSVFLSSFDISCGMQIGERVAGLK